MGWFRVCGRRRRLPIYYVAGVGHDVKYSDSYSNSIYVLYHTLIDYSITYFQLPPSPLQNAEFKKRGLPRFILAACLQLASSV